MQSSTIKERDILFEESHIYFIFSNYLANEATKYFTKEEIELYGNLTATDKQRLFLNAPEGAWHKIGVEKADFIVQCNIGAQDCYDNFTLYMNPRFFNCYTLQYAYENSRPMGEESGLSIILAGQDLSAPYLYNTWSKADNSKSIRVVIHEKNTLPEPLKDAMEVMPGLSTSIGILQKKIERIDTQNSRCRKDTFVYIGDMKMPMSQSYCIEVCYVSYIHKKCGCVVLGTIGIYGIQTGMWDYKFCLHTDLNNLTETVERGLCYLNLMKSADHEVKDCLKSCIWNCEEITYDYKISYSSWPEEMVVNDFIHKYVDSKPQDVFYKMYYEKMTRLYHNSSKEKTSNELSVGEAMNEYAKALQQNHNETIIALLNETIFSPAIKSAHLNAESFDDARIRWVQDTFYRVNIYFKQPIVEVHRQILNSNMADLWSSIGGILGLWLGLTVVGGIEILGFIANLGQLFISKLFTRTQVKPKTSDLKIIDIDLD